MTFWVARHLVNGSPRLRGAPQPKLQSEEEMIYDVCVWKQVEAGKIRLMLLQEGSAIGRLVPNQNLGVFPQSSTVNKCFAGSNRSQQSCNRKPLFECKHFPGVQPTLGNVLFKEAEL